MPKTPMLRVRNGKANKDALQRQPYVCSNGTFAIETCAPVAAPVRVANNGPE